MSELMPSSSWRRDLGWSLTMAWRDSRGQRGLLGLFVLCIVFGIGALVAIRSLQANLEDTIEQESRSLVGADLRLSTRSPFSPALERWIARQPGDKSREVRTRSMAWFPEQESSRLVQVRALESGFPFYGALETTPEGMDFRATSGALPGALVEAGLMAQLGVQPGDRVRLGEVDYQIVAALDRVAGEAELTGFFAPRIFVPYTSLAESTLLQKGSVADYRIYFRFADGLTEKMEATLDEARTGVFLDVGVRVTTVKDRRESLERVLGNLFAYLGLVGFIALLLGGLGVAGAVQAYVQPKLAQVATLRSLGASSRAAFAIYLWQVLFAGALGAALGVAVGVGTQWFLPRLLGPFIPFEIDLRLDRESIFFGFGFGWLAAFLFALRPLLGVRRVSPLRALRADFETRRRSDPAAIGVSFLLVGLGVAFSIWQAPKWWQGLAFAGGLAIATGILWLGAWGMRALLRKTAGNVRSYPVRLALSSLYRPGNRTLFVVSTLGLGVFLIATLALSRTLLLAQIATDRDAEDRPNVLVFDVQPDQQAGVEAILEEAGFRVDAAMPVVTMRVRGVKGRSLREWREMPDSPIDEWVYGWEFRVTYRDRILSNATILAGEFTGQYAGDEPIPISLAENLPDDLGVGVGDTIEWDVQGLPMRTVVGSIRQIDWELGRQNFGVLWPTGVLEGAPAMFALATRSPSRTETLALQRTLSEQYANVSLLDLSLLFETIDEVLGRMAFVVQFMAAFTVLAGLVVLFGALATSRSQRLREGILLRTLGASGAVVRRTFLWEYFTLGLLAAVVGCGLSILAASALARWVFEQPLALEIGPLVALGTGVVGVTVGLGWLSTRGLLAAPPLRILREGR